MAGWLVARWFLGGEMVGGEIPWWRDDRIPKLISLKPVSKRTNHNTLLSLSKRKILLGVPDLCNLSNRARACLVTNPSITHNHIS